MCPKCRLHGLKSFEGKFRCDNCGAVFNTFYYSWSPAIATQIWQSESLQAVGRVLISPLLGILHVSTVVNSVFSFSPELGIVVTGLVASSLIGLVYFFPVTLIPLAVARKYGKAIVKVSNLKPLLIPWVASLGLTALSGVLSSPILMMIGTGMLVIFTIALMAGTFALKLLQLSYLNNGSGKVIVEAS